MLLRNTKYTALEILTEAGFEKPEELFGKFGIKISGISGIVDPKHIILISKGTEKLVVSAKGEVKEVELADNAEGKDNVEISEDAKASLKAAGEKRTKEMEKVAVKVEEAPKE